MAVCEKGQLSSGLFTKKRTIHSQHVVLFAIRIPVILFEVSVAPEIDS